MMPIRTTGAAADGVLEGAAEVVMGGEPGAEDEGAVGVAGLAVVVGAEVVVGAKVVGVEEGELLWLLQAGSRTTRHRASDNTNHQTFFLITKLPP
jgi:hypothetical protein